MLAAVVPDDDEQTILRKLRVVATYVDILIARRLWNFRLIAYSYMQYAMFLAMQDIRRKPLDELVRILKGNWMEIQKHSPVTTGCVYTSRTVLPSTRYWPVLLIT